MTGILAPLHARNLRCYRCQGSLFWEMDEDDDLLAECLSCGRLQPHEHIAPAEPQRDALREGVRTPLKRESNSYMDSVKGPGWIQNIRDAVAAIVAEDAEIEAKRAAARTEAERCVAALRAYGAADVPVLPWVRPVVPVTRGGKPAKTCSVCGTPKSPSNGKYIDGRWTCFLCQRNQTPAVAS